MKFSILLGVGVLLACVVWLLAQNRRLQFDDDIADLNQQLSGSAYPLNSLSNTLQEPRLQVGPSNAALSQQAPDEVSPQPRQSRASANAAAFDSFTDPENARELANESIPRLYDSYLNALGIPGTERQRLMEAMVDFGAQRYQMLGELLAGSISREQAVTLFGANALSRYLQNSLTTAQQDDLRQYDLLLKRDTLREAYLQSLRSTGTAIDGATQDQVTGALIDEVVSAENNWGALVAEDGSMLRAYNNSLAAFDRARDGLGPQLDTQQLGHLDRFIDIELSGIDVILEVTSDGSGRVSITQARIGVENLPQ